jgi:hypothetical protein
MPNLVKFGIVRQMPNIKWHDHGTHIEPKTSSAGYVTLTTDIPSSTEKGCLFLRFIANKSQEGQKFKNPAVEQSSSLQSCIVRPETNAR